MLVERLETALRTEHPNGAAATNGTAEAAEEPLVDITAPDTAAAEAPDAAAATAVRTTQEHHQTSLAVLITVRPYPDTSG